MKWKSDENKTVFAQVFFIFWNIDVFIDFGISINQLVLIIFQLLLSYIHLSDQFHIYLNYTSVF